MLVESLPNLVSLDISGTNLAGTGICPQNFMTGGTIAQYSSGHSNL